MNKTIINGVKCYMKRPEYVQAMRWSPDQPKPPSSLVEFLAAVDACIYFDHEYYVSTQSTSFRTIKPGDWVVAEYVVQWWEVWVYSDATFKDRFVEAAPAPHA